MKKLMVAFAVVATAMAANAITYAWGTGPAVAYGDTSGEAFHDGTYYLIQGNAASAEAAVNAILAAGLDGYAAEFGTQVAGAYNSATYDTSTYALSTPANGSWDGYNYAVVWESDDTSSLPFYQLILDTANNGFYVSEIANSDYTTTGATWISMANEGTTTYDDTVTAYQGSGWYTVAGAEPGPGPEPGGVPEPTSGLLLLVGLAGMALKRKIA